MALKNMKEVKRKKEQLEFQSKFYKKELAISATGIFSSFAENFRALAFDFGYRLVSRLIFSRRKKHHVKIE
jgi:phage repressor protein C with HTH and peptisase S24 domain